MNICKQIIFRLFFCLIDQITYTDNRFSSLKPSKVKEINLSTNCNSYVRIFIGSERVENGRRRETNVCWFVVAVASQMAGSAINELVRLNRSFDVVLQDYCWIGSCGS